MKNVNIKLILTKNGFEFVYKLASGFLILSCNNDCISNSTVLYANSVYAHNARNGVIPGWDNSSRSLLTRNCPKYTNNMFDRRYLVCDYAIAVISPMNVKTYEGQPRSNEHCLVNIIFRYKFK